MPTMSEPGAAELVALVAVLLVRNVATGTRSEITDLDAITPVQQGQIGRKLCRLQRQELDPAGGAHIQEGGDALVIKLVQGGGCVAEQVVLSIVGKYFDGVDRQQGTLECRVMVEDHQVNLGEPVEYARIADQYAIVKAQSDWPGPPRAGTPDPARSRSQGGE